jgi:hypothetical protein
MTLEAIEDITPYDVYSTLTVKDSIPAEHIEYISELLMETILDDNQPDRLTVSQPPRTGKSSLITLSFPFWLILMNPTLNILIVNYSQGLADDFGMILRQLFIDNQELLSTRNIYLSEKEHAKSRFRFENKQGELLGSIKLVGVGGPITGRDVDICICDDLIKGHSDCTPTLLDKLYSWYQNILIPRLEPWSKLFMLGTRWHSQDVIGRLMQEQPDKYRFITIRALEDDGTCIWSNRYDPKFFIDRKDEVGERVFNAQYQGQPLDETGDFFNLDKVRFITDDELPNYKIISKVRSYDCAYSDDTKGDVNDRTASVLMLRTIDDYYIIRELRADRYGERLFNVIQSTARLDTPSIPVLIETGTVGGSSKALFDIYKDRLQGYRVEQSKPIQSKVDRAYGFKEAILDGKVLICLDDYSRGQLLEEMRGFPLMKHDDIIDACSYAYNYLSSKGGGNMIGTGAKRHRRSLRL